mgnify:FL=1
MNWNLFLEDRKKWQNATVERIRNQLTYKASVVYNTNTSEKLVVIYGTPQIGKTTLILFLLGIDSKYQKRVYDTLRAGIPSGNSSTSTAIMYLKTENERYGIGYSNKVTDIEYCTEKELEKRIQNVRENVENGKASEKILHIYIPKKFFSKEAVNSGGINIIDLPGVGSRNQKEKVHVEAMINKYMAVANVNIIACKANEINSLNEFVLPINMDWRTLPHKYIVVITHAYGQGIIKKFFDTERTMSFYEYVGKVYEENLNKILPTSMEFFPIDIGASLFRLLNDSGLTENDCKEVNDTVNRMAENIRKSIQKREGNELKNIIDDLAAYSDVAANRKIVFQDKKIASLKKEIEDLKISSEKKKKLLIKSKEKIKELKEFHNDYLKLKNMMVRLDVSEEYKKISDIVSKMTNKGKISDSDKKILDEISNILKEFTKKSLKIYYSTYDDSECTVIYDQIKEEVDFEDKILKYYKRGVFFSKKIKEQEILVTIEEIFDMFNERLKEILNEKLKSKIELKKKEEKKYQLYCKLIELCTQGINRNRTKEERKWEEKVEREKIRQQTQERRELDKKQIDKCLEIGREEFQKYYRDVVTKVETSECSKYEKVYYLIYLGLLEKDYKNIVGLEIC